MTNQCSWMQANWDLPNQYSTWLMVEKAVALAQAFHGVIPMEAANQIANLRQVNLASAKLYEQQTHHDLNSFLKSLSDDLGDEGRQYLHFGLTSSDVVDTALFLRLKYAIQHLYKTRDPGPVREHFKGALESVSVGKMAGPVGTHATISPAIERDACRVLGLGVDSIPTQVISRDRIAQMVLNLIFAARGLGSNMSGSMYALVALEDIALWHERDISHSSVERVFIPMFFAELDSFWHSKEGV